MEDFGFIIPRCIRTPLHNEYWIECINHIRKFYNEKIIIIDDNSIIKNEKDLEMFENVSIVYSEPDKQGCGEFLGYYYAWKYKPFKKFIVLHDTMFIQEKINFPEDQNVVFLWYFDDWKHHSYNHSMKIINCINKNKDSIINLFHDTNSWNGCFGVSSFIKLDFLEKIFEKYDLSKLVNHIKNRTDREAMERIFAVIFYLNEEKLKVNPSIYGNVLEYKPWGQRWEEYKINKPNYKMIKVFSGR
jgi:hypothetical protein